MKTFLVLTQRGAHDEAALAGAVVLKDGLSPMAGLFAPFHFALHRAWKASAISASVFIAGAALLAVPGFEPVGAAVLICATVFFALEAGNLVERDLLRRGYALAAIVPAPRRAAVEEALPALLVASQAPSHRVLASHASAPRVPYGADALTLSART